MEPISVITIVETTTGIAGGTIFHNWLEKSGVDTTVNEISSLLNKVPFNDTMAYNIMAQTKCVGKDAFGTVVFKIIWLSHPQYCLTCDDIPKEVAGGFDLSENNECAIM